MKEVKAYGAQANDAPLKEMNIERRDLLDNYVSIDITYCGVCHSDIHAKLNDWGNAKYPIVPGHEIIGKVTAVGKDVTAHKIGDLVGVGCMVDSCQECSACEENQEMWCENGSTSTKSPIL